MTTTTEQPTFGLRLASMLVDHFAMVFIIAGGGLLIMSPFFLFSDYSTIHNPHNGTMFLGLGLMGFIFLILFSGYFNKDIFNGRSVAKRILKLQVVDNKSGQVATPVQCLLRNITIMIWPVEVLYTLFSPTRRLGDYIARTRVTFYNPSQTKTKINWTQFFLAVFFGLLLLAVTVALTFLVQILTGQRTI